MLRWFNVNSYKRGKEIYKCWKSRSMMFVNDMSRFSQVQTIYFMMFVNVERIAAFSDGASKK